MEKEKKKEKSCHKAAAYCDDVKAFSQDSRSIRVLVSSIIVTRFLCQKHCALNNKAKCANRCHICFLQVSTLSWLFDCMVCRHLVAPSQARGFDAFLGWSV